MREAEDGTVAYVVAAQPCFEDLKQAASHLAGFLVLEASGSRAVTPDHPMLAAAAQVSAHAADALRSARVTARTRTHHAHLLNASAQIETALRLLRAGADALLPIESAYAELRSASRALPGFSMISFEQGCCAQPHIRRNI